MALISNNLRDTKLHLTLRIIVIAQGTDNNSKSKLHVLILKLLKNKMSRNSIIKKCQNKQVSSQLCKQYNNNYLMKQQI
ncbi:hypothetical protein TRFO_20656 [Tritrichomonas foetus]|uniref:Uncharacterized protein n=1 Tax=Tritrichomonas foetus TaxID=1144522 RepID=A0A1J4JG82_9EUKA|nr:hypothetical protein TRFO_09035 [Tritrichomonas foetus]OHT06255.1 hypothetical protein TRFO_25739 [Tritrichomonas foetus]OHT10128.1 hypothetical protein TRFO_20656 [Tritrichomonas foetus]|eukprot:OHS98176.1 hypothetical protein TRFO_09035 [Tritrichomonas foetus]